MQASAAIHQQRRAWDGFSRQFLRVFLLVDALSLLAPLVAVIWQLSLFREFQMHSSPLELLALALAIWTLYSADHVLDTFRVKPCRWEPNRKTFYRRHWPLMAALALCGGLAAIALALVSLTHVILAGAFAISGFVFAYFLSVHSLPAHWRGLWPREAIVALGFSLGTFLPLMRPGVAPSFALLAPAIIFFLLCWLNCCAVETWEWQRSGVPLEHTPHITTRWIAHHLSTLAISVGSLALLIGRCLGRGNEFGLAGFSSGAALFLLAQTQALLPDSILGVSADLALCVPALFLALR